MKNNEVRVAAVQLTSGADLSLIHIYMGTVDAADTDDMGGEDKTDTDDMGGEDEMDAEDMGGEDKVDPDVM